MRISDGLTPPGGWKFQEGEYWLYGGNSKELIHNLTEHRKSNGQKVGDPWKDISNQIIERCPQLALH